jgi:phosphopentomutase
MAAPFDQRRAFVVVIDGLGAGAEPDAAAYGDAGANTLAHVARAVGGLDLPAFEHLGLGNIEPLEGVTPSIAPVVHGALSHDGPGKDSTTGHWELMGVVSEQPLPTFPDGIPDRVVALLAEATGLRFCGGGALDGIAAIEQFGAHHLQTGEVILYTSVDSVVQLAAHEDALPVDRLHEACRSARAVLTGADAVGRVIARPFRGVPGAFERGEGRRDFSVAPPSRSYLDAALDRGVPVRAVGKVADLFAGRGIDAAHPGASNDEALASLDALVDRLAHGLVVANLIDTDQLHGHRKDIAGFDAALRVIDARLARWLRVLGPGDLLILTADHGVDLAMTHSDHTREHVPLLATFPGHGGRRHDGPMADVGASALAWLTGEDEPDLPGSSFL